MASVLAEDGAESLPPAVSAGLGFDVKVFEQYLDALLPPGECQAESETITRSERLIYVMRGPQATYIADAQSCRHPIKS
jgi:hypothetical protein